MLILKNKYGKYETPCNNEYNGKKITFWMSVNFKKGLEPNKDKLYINPLEWWFSAYQNKDGHPVPSLFIKDWREDDPANMKPKASEVVEVNNQLEFESDDLPFY